MAFIALTVTPAQVSGFHADMPLLVTPSAITGFGAITLAEAQSSRFYSDEAKTIELAREVVGADEIHVKVPSVNTSTVIYVDYDGVRSDYAVTDTFGRNNVWSDYLHVVHLTNGINDSTSNGNDGTNIGGATQVADGYDFDGDNDRISFGSVSYNLTNGTIQPFSISVVTNWSGDLTSVQPFYQSDDSVANPTILFTINTNGDGLLGVVDNSSNFRASASLAYPANVDAYSVGRLDSSGNIFFRQNDEADNTLQTQSVTSVKNSTEDPFLGATKTTTSFNRYYNGIMRWFRLRGSFVSNDWCVTEYNNLINNSSFWTASVVEDNKISFLGFHRLK